METIILSVFGIMALVIIALQVRRGVKGFLSTDESNKCCNCGSCSSSCGINKHEGGFINDKDLKGFKPWREGKD